MPVRTLFETLRTVGRKDACIARRALYPILLLAAMSNVAAAADEIALRVEQITHGPAHHQFGYIGHVGTIPWNASGRYIAALRFADDDRLPSAADAAEIVLIDTENDYNVSAIDTTRAWNLQQGTMLYWNPLAPETQLFFNDRDPDDDREYTVLYDVAQRRRLSEYRDLPRSYANSGMAQRGGAFLAINYGRLARLRPVTGYVDAHDWTAGELAPQDDGLFHVDVNTGRSSLLVSYRQLRDHLRAEFPAVTEQELFINHTLWSRDDARIFFFVRANFRSRQARLNQPMTIRPDGSGLRREPIHIGGHPEWLDGHRMVGSHEVRQVIYDTRSQTITETLGTREVFPNPEGDIAISPDAMLLANGFRQGANNVYAIYRFADAAYAHSPGISHGGYEHGPLRLDPAPCWNRDGTALLVPGMSTAGDETRQLFIIGVDARR